MARTVVPYDGILPYIEEQDPYSASTTYLQRNLAIDAGFEIVSGRRPSTMLVVNPLRQTVAAWREGGYVGACDLTRQLLLYWFEEDHLAASGSEFRYYFCQREAIETLIYLVEVRRVLDAGDLVRGFSEADSRTLFGSEEPQIYTTTAGSRRVRRAFVDSGFLREGDQELPPEGLPRYAFKMATGSGKTVLMAMAIVWSYFHKRRFPDSHLSTNFLVLAPNVIVYERLERDFGANRVFHDLPLIPEELRGEWQLKPVMRGEQVDFGPFGSLILTNVQQLREEGEQDEDSENAVQRLLGRKPVKDPLSYGPSLLERLKGLPDLVSINDEAHHLHDDELAWNRKLLAIHESLKPQGLALWLDFSATPKDQNGNNYPWVIVDYPLAQAVEDGIVKAPVLVHKEDRSEPSTVSAATVADDYSPWLLAAVDRLRRHEEAYQPLGVKPVLFIMTERNALADALHRWLASTAELGLSQDEVLLIHTTEGGDVRDADLPKLRKLAREVDSPTNKVRVVVSVLMLKEGWDVRNVTIVLGLRPFTAKAGILSEQAIGRGLRLIPDLGPDRVQTLEVMGSARFEDVVRGLDTEGVPLIEQRDPPPPPIRIEPVREKTVYDIAIATTSPRLERDYRKLDGLDVRQLQPIWERDELPEPFRISLRAEFWPTGVRAGLPEAAIGAPPLPNELTTLVTREVERAAGLQGSFSELYPKVRDYLAHRSLGRSVDLDDPGIRDRLRSFTIREAVVKYLAREIGRLTLEHQPITLRNSSFSLSSIKPFIWRRKHCRCQHTVFNYVAAFNEFEIRFAEFADVAADVIRFAALGTTEQDSGVQFRIDYMKPSGARGFYHPDWIVVQKTADGEINWVVETKGRVWPGTENKDAAVTEWCRAVSEQTGGDWRYIRVNQALFDSAKPSNFRALLDVIRGTLIPVGEG